MSLTELINKRREPKPCKGGLMYKGAKNEDLLFLNSAMITQYLKRNGICSRVELSRATALTPASISKTVSMLIECGIVKEVGLISGKKGRRSIGLSLVEDRYLVIGVKLSRRSFSVGVFDIGGNMYDVFSEAIEEKQEFGYTMERIKSVIDRYLERFSNVVVIGLAVPGPFQRTEGKIALMTEMNNWFDLPLVDEFVNAYSIPVIIEHDANAGAYAEWWFGAHSTVQKGTLVYFLVGEGVGAGVLVNGSILYGSQGVAGEVGHISVDVSGEKCACGNRGCLEMYLSSIAFVKHATKLLPKHPDSVLNGYSNLTSDDIFSAAEAGDQFAIELVKRAGMYLGYGIVTIVNAYDPSIVVVGNSMAKGGQRILNAAKAVVKERILPAIYKDLKIVLSDFSEDPILLGASAVATDYFLKNPGLYLDKSKRH
jgi:predicted NBD/HSP70 family sugar kinase